MKLGNVHAMVLLCDVEEPFFCSTLDAGMKNLKPDAREGEGMEQLKEQEEEFLRLFNQLAGHVAEQNEMIEEISRALNATYTRAQELLLEETEKMGVNTETSFFWFFWPRFLILVAIAITSVTYLFSKRHVFA